MRVKMATATMVGATPEIDPDLTKNLQIHVCGIGRLHKA